MGLAVGESKEDLHIRMTELQKKLRDSEEERRVLEKTCDILINAFREEQKMYYNTLNEKYEKFLEDFNIRRKRNDIILKSLARVEDRAKVIHAKTEKLKLLKNRYISYLKQNEFFKVDESKGKFSSHSLNDTIGNEVVGKSVHWKTPVVTGVQEFSTKDVYFIPEGALGLNKLEPMNSKECEKLEGKTSKNVAIDYTLNDWRKNIEERNLNGTKIPPGSIACNSIIPNENDHSQMAQPVATRVCNSQSLSYIQNKLNSLHNEIANVPSFNESQNGSSLLKTGDSINENSLQQHENVSNLPSELSAQKTHTSPVSSAKPDNTENIKSDSSDLNVMKELREIGMLKHQEPVDKLKVALEDCKEVENTEDELNKNIVKKYIIEGDNKSEEYNKPDTTDVFKEKKNGLISPEFDKVLQSDDSSGTVGNNLTIQVHNNIDNANSPSDRVKYMKGLDGVDYDNETYPESYYEQPVYHSNHTSLASKVILEEDEYELDADQEEIVSNGARKISLEESNNSESNPPIQILQITTEEYDVEDKRHSDNNSGHGNGIEENCQDIHIKNLAEQFKRSDFDNVDDSESVESGLVGKLSADTGEEWPKAMKTNAVEATTDDSKSEDSTKVDSYPPADKLSQTKNTEKKSLVQLLESDSESFQIEHGDMISGNDDSDFDFSFKLNPE